ncbi:MAG: purine-binding chemotaxis protein CheW [Fusobacteria bacterium]|nr:purine-binding chemotaxis protein CheW [Fusobacteriota bacterium]
MEENLYEMNESINSILGFSAYGKQYLSFTVEDEEYAFSILKIREIIGMKKITKVPNLPPYIKGVINLRGNIIHLIDIRERFNMSLRPYDKTTVVIIIETKDKLIGIIVDQVKDVINIKEEDVQKPLEFSCNIEEEFLEGLSKVNDRLVVILDVDKLLMKV